jgi:selenocysteine lyase/cysteine desulfurase
VLVDEWEPAGVYLNTASYGLPPRAAFEALQAALADWRVGRTGWRGWHDQTDVGRAAWARIAGCAVDDVAVGANVSGLIGLVAASLPAGARVVVVENDYTSVVWPFLVRGDVRAVPVAQLAEAAADADVLAFSAVQSATGEVADLDAIAAAAEAHGVMSIVDATQALGWLPMDASRFDVVACAAYKWLMTPRGVALMAVRRERLDAIEPVLAGWFAAEDVHASYYGTDMELAANARRLDTSPAWFSWVAAVPALELIERIGVERIWEHDVGLANRFRAGLGLEPGDSAIVTTEVGNVERLEAAGIIAPVRAGRLRTSWHAYNSEADVDRVLDVLAG